MITEGTAFTPTEALRATSWSAGANTGVWLPVSQLEGLMDFCYNCGAITGNVVFKLQSADDDSGTNAADITGKATSAITTAGTTGKLSIHKSAVGNAYVGIVATVTTGPVLASAILVARNKTAS